MTRLSPEETQLLESLLAGPQEFEVKLEKLDMVIYLHRTGLLRYHEGTITITERGRIALAENKTI